MKSCTKCGHSSDTQGCVYCFFLKSLKEAVSHPRCREIPWPELRSHSQSDGVMAQSPIHYTQCATAYSEPLALTEGGFSVCLSVFHRNPSWQDFLVYSHLTPISAWILPTFLLGPSPVSNRVRNLSQIQSMLIGPRRKNDPLADHSIKIDL